MSLALSVMKGGHTEIQMNGIEIEQMKGISSAIVGWRKRKKRHCNCLP